MQERFRIIFRCKILPDQELGQVKQNLQKLAGLPAAKIDELFSRAETVLKADADKATAIMGDWLHKMEKKRIERMTDLAIRYIQLPLEKYAP